MQNNNIEQLQKILGYKFKDINLLMTALTHSSFANENNVESYERLEFLGDAILQVIVSEYLYKNSNYDAGDLSKLRARLVSSDNLSNIIMNLNIDGFFRLGHSINNTLSKKIYCDLFESILGSIYLDCGMEVAISFVHKFIINDNKMILSDIDYKTLLQEKIGAENIEYVVLDKSGESHDPIFTVVLKINNVDRATVHSKNIKEGEKECAKIILNNLKEN